MVTTNKVFIAGEVRGDGIVREVNQEEIKSITRNVIRSIGYEQDTFHWKEVEIAVNLHAQSADIGMGVDALNKNDEGAGDQGIMFGYATDETEAYMPIPIKFSHDLLSEIRNSRISKDIIGLGPDAKSQFSIKYRNNVPIDIHSLVCLLYTSPSPRD